jgi:hypothetical protein
MAVSVDLADGGPERPGRADFSGEFHAVHLLEKARRNDFRRSAAISCKDLRCQTPTQNFARFRQIRGKPIRSKIKQRRMDWANSCRGSPYRLACADGIAVSEFGK